VPLEFFAPGIFIKEVPWPARRVGSGTRRSGKFVQSSARRAEGTSDASLLVPDQPVMLVVRHRRDGPWAIPF
jgi:hypothetical protein